MINALKYTPEGGITLNWGSIGPDEWYFSVQDTGPGMDRELIGKLSDPTDEAKPNRHVLNEIALPLAESLLANRHLIGPSPDKGISLFIVRQLCKLLSARLIIDSQPSQGSTFRLVLPRNY